MHRTGKQALADIAQLTHAEAEHRVRELYRGLLRREPDQGGLEHHVRLLTEGVPLAQLMASFVQSDEFRAFSAGANEALPDKAPAMAIDLAPPADRLLQLWRHVAATWRTLGEQDPYWSVLTDPAYHLSEMAQAEILERFYATGQSERDRLLGWLARNGLALSPEMTISEYGCGVGRITQWLAPLCHRLRGFDISQAHLDRARERLRARRIRNVTLHLVREPNDLGLLAGTDLFFSVIVLQHNPPPIMRLIVGQVFRHLNPGGIAYFQIPTYAKDYGFSTEDYIAGLHKSEGMEMHALPQAEIFRLAREHQVEPLEVRPDALTGGWGYSSSFLFRKRPAAPVL